jgi:hypothetical protein
MKTTIKLCEYDDILAPRIIYSLLCLTSLKNKFYGVCSKAFVKVFFTLSSSFFLALMIACFMISWRHYPP